jgi:hypothetical protein
LQLLPLARQIVEAVRLEHIVRLEKSIERVASAETEQPPQLRLGQMVELVLFERQHFEHAAFKLADGAETPGQIVGNVNRYIHAGILAETSAGSKIVC